MKKIEKASQFLQASLDLFKCPICSESFKAVQDKQMVCQNQHSFNLSKKGTVHFLLKEANNQYTTEMFLARRDLAQAGFWNPILDYLFSQIEPKFGTHLDIGAGEGSHLYYLKDRGLGGRLIGLDISKEAINLAASAYEDIFWCVADLAQTPFKSGEFDTLLNIFSPSNYREINQLLKPGGRLLKVVPNSSYLIELREFLYDGDKSYSNDQVSKNFRRQFESYDIESQRLSYQIKLDQGQVQRLLKMTPLTWEAESEKILKLKNLSEFTITVDVQCLTAKKV